MVANTKNTAKAVTQPVSKNEPTTPVARAAQAPVAKKAL